MTTAGSAARMRSSPALGSNPLYAPFETVEDALLAAVARMYYLTSLQLCQRFWQPTSLTAMRAKTKELADRGYLQRVLLRRAARSGSAQHVFTLGAAGRRRLRRLGLPLARVRPSETGEKSELFLWHTLALNDVLLSAERLGLLRPDIRLVDMRHERDLKRTPLPTAYGPAIPDGWLEWHVLDGERWLRDCFVLELDRGTEGVEVVRRKLRRLVTLDMAAYARLFGTPSFSGFLLVTTRGERRLALLRQWLAAELAAQRREDAAELFYLTAVDAASVTPETFFSAPHWWQPGTDRRTAPIQIVIGESPTAQRLPGADERA